MTRTVPSNITASAVPSNLSNAKYLYDFVVAATQDSINATMMAFLAQLREPVVTICYVADAHGIPTPIDYETLKANARGTDPFSIPANVDVGTSEAVQDLFTVRFMLGFRARLGLPHVGDPASLPDIVQLGTTASSAVFNMYCSTFTIVQYTPSSGYTPASWMNISQSPNSPWVFTSIVDLRLENVPGTAYHLLPADVQQKIQNLGSNAFSVQQLLFDLSNARLQSQPKIASGVAPGTPAYNALQTSFLGAYFAQMQADGQPLLGCSITTTDAPASTLKPTSLDLMVNAYLDDQSKQVGGPLTTLNYLCSVGGKPLSTPSNFSWNWVPDAVAQQDHDGVASINRNTLANYFRTMLTPYVQQNCLLTWTHVWLSGFLDGVVNYSWKLTQGQTPTVTTPATGATVLSYAYSSESSDEAGLNGDMGSLKLKNDYTLTVAFTGKTIVITQHQVIYVHASVLATRDGGNVVDKTITDTYNLNVDESGRLVAKLSPVVHDASVDPRANGFLNFFADVNSLLADVEEYAQYFKGTELDIPINVIQDFVFPGGKTFVFKNVGFSDYQDLVSFISYADVTGNNTVPTVPATNVKTGHKMTATLSRYYK